MVVWLASPVLVMVALTIDSHAALDCVHVS